MFDYTSRYFNLFQDERFSIARKLFHTWEWNISDSTTGTNFVNRMYREIDFEVNREAINIMIQNRSRAEKFNLTIRRLLSNLMNLVILFGGVFLIIKV